jgi:hypothetical protein
MSEAPVSATSPQSHRPTVLPSPVAGAAPTPGRRRLAGRRLFTASGDPLVDGAAPIIEPSLRNLGSAGVTPRAATRVSQRTVRLGDLAGTIEAGRLADPLVVQSGAPVAWWMLRRSLG